MSDFLHPKKPTFEVPCLILSLCAADHYPPKENREGKCSLARRRFIWGRSDVFNARFIKQKERAPTENQLNME